MGNEGNTAMAAGKENEALGRAGAGREARRGRRRRRRKKKLFRSKMEHLGDSRGCGLLFSFSKAEVKKQRILRPPAYPHMRRRLLSAPRRLDSTQSIKTAIFHHGAEQPTESHIERTDPCMEKAQPDTRTRLGRGSKSRLIPPRSRPCVSRL